MDRSIQIIMLRFTTFLAFLLAHPALALLNGASDTPVLGWLSWQRYRCDIACNDATSPNCFNEKLIKDTADAPVMIFSIAIADACFSQL